MATFRASQASPPASGSSRVNVGDTERLASVLGGALLTYLGLQKFNLLRITTALTGGALLYRGLTGFCPVNEAVGRDSTQAGRTGKSVELHTSLTVNKPREEVYAFWRRLENLPRFMHHLVEVQQLDERRSRWTAAVPGGGGHVSWNAEIEAEEEGRRLAWRSVPGSAVDNAGEVRFEDATQREGTEVHARIAYRLPAGAAGKTAAKLLNPVFEQMVKEDLRRFKHIMEAGVVPTIEGQTSGRAAEKQRAKADGAPVTG